jgi:hypothetical protein
MKPALAALALILFAHRAQEKITLKSQPRKGDRISSAEKMAMKIDLSIAAGGQTQKMAVEQKGSKKKTMEILEVEGEKVTKAFFHCEEDVEEKRDPGQEGLVKREKPLHGRKVTVQAKDGKTAYDPEEGLDQEAKNSLRLEDNFSKTFPARPIAVGETWDVSGDALKSMFQDQKMDGKLTAKLTEVKEFEGRRCAFLDVAIEMKGQAEGGVTITIALKGAVIVWIERGYTLQAKLEGTTSMAASNDQFEMKGEGPMTVDVRSTVN